MGTEGSGDGVNMSVDSGPNVNRILQMLEGDQGKIEQLKRMLNIQPEKDKNKWLLDDHTFRRVEKFSGEVGTFQEWSFGLSMTAQTVEQQLGNALDEIKRNASSPLTEFTFQFEASDGTPVNPC